MHRLASVEHPVMYSHPAIELHRDAARREEQKREQWDLQLSRGPSTDQLTAFRSAEAAQRSHLVDVS